MTLTAPLDLRDVLLANGYQVTVHIPAVAVLTGHVDVERQQLAGAQQRSVRALERNLAPAGLAVDDGIVHWRLERDPHDGWVLAADWRAY